jgi:hypothetical protein
MDLLRRLVRVAQQHPETRKYLVPIIRKHLGSWEPGEVIEDGYETGTVVRREHDDLGIGSQVPPAHDHKGRPLAARALRLPVNRSLHRAQQAVDAELPKVAAAVERQLRDAYGPTKIASMVLYLSPKKRIWVARGKRANHAHPYQVTGNYYGEIAGRFVWAHPKVAVWDWEDWDDDRERGPYRDLPQDPVVTGLTPAKPGSSDPDRWYLFVEGLFLKDTSGVERLIRAWLNKNAPALNKRGRRPREDHWLEFIRVGGSSYPRWVISTPNKKLWKTYGRPPEHQDHFEHHPPIPPEPTEPVVTAVSADTDSARYSQYYRFFVWGERLKDTPETEKAIVAWLKKNQPLLLPNRKGNKLVLGRMRSGKAWQIITTEQTYKKVQKRLDQEWLGRKASMRRTAGEVRFIKDKSGDKETWGFHEYAGARNLTPDYEYEPKKAKHLAKVLRSTLAALGHAMSAYTTFTKIKSKEISPDGQLGGLGYVSKISNMRQQYMNSVEAMSALSDTIYDEINAPHWNPALKTDGSRERDGVKQILQDVEEIREDPEEWAEEEEAEMDAENAKQARARKAQKKTMRRPQRRKKTTR